MREIGHIPDDNLLLAGCLDGVHEVLVVHGIDLTRASNQRRLGKQVGDFLDKRSIRAGVKRCGKDSWDLIVVGNSCQRRDIGFEFIRIEVANELDETRLFGRNGSALHHEPSEGTYLVVDEEENTVLNVESLVCGRRHCERWNYRIGPVGFGVVWRRPSRGITVLPV